MAETEYKITTTLRYLYLNSYAFLLLFGGIGIMLVPLYPINRYILIVQIIAAFVCIKNSYKIFRTWKGKKRRYALLIEQNISGFNPESFYEYMQAPCGRLLVRIVLKDLNQRNRYTELKKLKKPLFQRIRESCKPRKTVIYIKNQEQ